MQPPRVSVVIASYNHAPFVAACLHSVLAQTWQDFEVIVTDDGSTDGSADIVADFIARRGDERFRLHRLAANRGACIALNHGVRRARGEYVAILNSDDEFLPDKLRRQVVLLDADPRVAAVFGLPAFVDERGAPLDDAGHKDHAVFRVANRGRQQWLRHFFDHGNALCHPTVLIRRRCYETVGLYDARLAQVPDFDLWVRLCMRAGIHVIPEPLIRFRILDAQRNASAARPEVVIRDAWERRRVLERFLALSPADFTAAFPEYAGRGESIAALLAERALQFDFPFYADFALEVLYRELRPDGDGPAYRELIRRTGARDIYRLFAAGGGAPR
jgi:glycosyltransferase involved in cell wall biosynthesis